MQRDRVGQEDQKRLLEIAAVLDRVGQQLDAADRTRGHDPWSAIAGQEAEMRRLAEGLTDRFRETHFDLARRLLTSMNLHLAWANLRDEIEQILIRDDRLP